MLNLIKSFILRHISTKGESKKMLQEEYLPVSTFVSLYRKRSIFKDCSKISLRSIEISLACRYRCLFQEEPRTKGEVEVYPESFLRTHVPKILSEGVYMIEVIVNQMFLEASKSKGLSKNYDK